MAITSKPLSIANVVNGKSPFTHYAWAWNSLGTDRFTQTYPNDNKLRTTTSTSTIVGTGASNQTDARTNYLMVTTPFNTLWDGVVVGDTFTFSCDVTIAGSGFAGQFRAQTSKDPYIGMNPYYKITKAETVRVAFTGVVTQGLLDSTTVNTIQLRYDNVPTTVSLTVSKPKLEIGSVATPYTPAPSEDQTNAYPLYQGFYTDNTATGSTNPQKYTWQRIRGNDGADGKDGVAGKDGVGLSSTSITYAQSASGTTPPTTGWSAQVPTLIKGQYLWTKTVWTYTDASTETGYTVSYNAKDGNNGTDGIAGKDGVGISSTIVEYAASASGTVKPTSGWSTTIPAVSQGQYLWTRTTWKYTDSTSEQGFSVARQGVNGQNGQDAPYVTAVQVQYAQSLDGVTPPTSGWVNDKPTRDMGYWQWQRVRDVFSNGTYGTWVATSVYYGRDAIIVSATEPNPKVDNMLWQKPSDPNVLMWNGSAWVQWGISIDNIVADNAVIKNGKFQRLDGVEVWASVFGSPYVSNAGDERDYIGNYALENRGTFTIDDGMITNRYTVHRKDTGEQIGQGRSYYNNLSLTFTESRYNYNVSTSEPTHTWNLSYGIDGIQGVDSRSSYTGARMDINDMLHERTYDNQIELKADYEPYGTVANGQFPLAERHGRIVELFGAVKNTKVIPASGARTILNEPLPVWARPRSVVRRIQQGSGSNRFLLEIYPDGTISVARYGTGSYIDIPVGAWINIGCTYTGGDVFKSPFEFLPDD